MKHNFLVISNLGTYPFMGEKNANECFNNIISYCQNNKQDKEVNLLELRKIEQNGSTTLIDKAVF